MVRINALDTPFAYRDLVEVVEAAGDRHRSGHDSQGRRRRATSQFVDTLLTQIEAHAGVTRGRSASRRRSRRAHGFLHAREIASASPRLEALIFGAGDFAASMRMPSAAIGEADAHDAAYPGHRWHAVMHTIVAAARANGLRCIDGPYAGYHGHRRARRRLPDRAGAGLRRQAVHPPGAARRRQRRLSLRLTRRSTRAAAVVRGL